MDRFDITTANAALLLIDLQERFQSVIPTIAADQPVGRQTARLRDGAALLEVPTLISEQYPKGLGPTLPHLATPGATVFPKMHFSCVEDAALMSYLAGTARTHIIVAGIEAHVCVLATVADLIAGGRWVIVAADAVASRDPAHALLALEAMRHLGALTLPVESILFRLQRQAGIGAFKALSALVR
jgi:nicotinamidase-related amidase